MLLLTIPRLPYGYYVLLESCAEMGAQVTVAKELKYIAEDKEVELLERLDHICRMSSNLIRRL
jgi:four helix bundle protein